MDEGSKVLSGYGWLVTVGEEGMAYRMAFWT